MCEKLRIFNKFMFRQVALLSTKCRGIYHKQSIEHSTESVLNQYTQEDSSCQSFYSNPCLGT